MKDVYARYAIQDENIGHHAICIFNFIIWTPIILVLSWLLTKAVDKPAKDFAYECDI